MSSTLKTFSVLLVVIFVGWAIFSVYGFRKAEAGWYGTGGWSYRKVITIDESKVTGSSDLSSFPVLIDLTDSGLQANAQADGDDILFTSADGTTKLDHEIEIYTSATGRLTAWVEIPTLSYNTNTVIYMYYGNSGASSQQNATGVWETNYKGVWHLKDGTTLDLTDSTSNGGNGSPGFSPTATTGQIDGAANFAAASSQHVLVSDDDRYSFGNGTTDSPFTWSTWVYMPNSGTVAGNFIEKYVGFPGGEYALAPSNTDVLYGFMIDSSSGGYIGRTVSSMSTYIPSNTWALVTWTYSGGATNASNKIYINGVQRDDGNISSGTYTAMENSVYAVNFAKQQGLTGGYLDGKMDEVRLYAGERSADWIKTEYNNQSSTSTFYTISGSQTSEPSDIKIRGGGSATNSNVKIRGGLGWYSSSWAYRKPITINKSKVPNSNQTNFPVLVDITDANLASGAQADGDDILFTSGDGTTKLDHEIELYTSATGRLTAWVRIPTLYSERDTTIYMYYGNSGASNQQNATGVWDSNYKGVWHLKDGTILNVNDSTSNANNGSNTGSPTAAAGQIDGASDYTGSAVTNITGNSSLQLSGNYTMSAWVKFTATQVSNGYGFILHQDTTDSGFDLHNGGSGLNVAFFAGGHVFGGSTVLSTNTWYYVGYRYEAGVASTLYVNGVQDGSTASASSWNSTANWQIGNLAGSYPGGTLDEVRISSINRSADWIKTEYNNQSATSTFYTVGTQETNGNAPTRGGVKFR